MLAAHFFPQMASSEATSNMSDWFMELGYSMSLVFIGRLCCKMMLVDHLLCDLQLVLMVKKSPANVGDIGDMGSIPGSGRFPEEGYGNPLQYCYLENPIDRGAWRATVYRLHRVRHNWSDFTHTHTHTYTHIHTHTHEPRCQFIYLSYIYFFQRFNYPCFLFKACPFQELRYLGSCQAIHY